MQLAVAFGGSGLMSGAGLMKVGFLAASAVGSYLLGGKKQQHAQKLSDLKVSCSSYGRGIPEVWGTMRCSGNMIWATDIVEKKKYYNSKGKDVTGKKKDSKKGQKVYEYYANFAMSICAGPVEDLLRVWADSNLIYDKYNPDNDDLVRPGFSQGDNGDGGKTGKIGKGKGRDGGDSGRFKFRFYPGTEDQRQDPYMVEVQGADKVPAFRGECYLMFEDFALQDFGNRIPTITAEVAVRKKRKVSWGVVQNLDDHEFAASPLIQDTVFDPARYRLYSKMRALDGTYYLRVFDLSTMKEVKQVPWSQLGISSLIGVCANGDICGPTSDYAPSNAHEIVFVDGNTFVPKSRYGQKGNFPNLTTAPGNPSAAIPVFYTDAMVDLDGTTTTQRQITAVFDIFGDMHLYDENNTHMQGFDLPGFGLFPGFALTPGVPGIGKGAYYMMVESFYGTWFQLWEGDTLGNCKLIYSQEASLGLEFIYSSAPFVVIGAECVGFFEKWDSPDPEKRGSYVTKLDPATGDVLWRYRLSDSTQDYPDGGLRAAPVLTGNKAMFTNHFTGVCWEVDFAAERVTNFQMPGSRPTYLLGETYWSPRGALLQFIIDPEDSQGKYALAFVDRTTQVPATLKDICIDLTERVGLPRDKADVTELKDETITGYIMENPTSARDIIEDLSSVFMFDVVESDYVLKFVSRGKQSIATIPQKYLGTVNGEEGEDQITNDYFEEKIVQEIDCPERVVVTYINADDDYQQNTQHYKRPRSPMPVMSSREQIDINLPMAMKANAAKQMAQKVCMSIWSERVTHDFVLPWSYLMYDPTDVLNFQMEDGLTFSDRMMKMDFGANFAIEASGVSQTPATYDSDAVAGELGGVIAMPHSIHPTVRPIILDTPYLSDGDAEESGSSYIYYWAAGAMGAGFRYASLDRRLPPGDFVNADFTMHDAVWGTVIGTVPPPPNGSFATDDQTEIVLAPAHDFLDAQGNVAFEWTSIPDADWPSTDNMIVIGREIILFKTATVNDNGTVTLSTLIRGWRGTENAAYDHTATETFVIDGEPLRELHGELATINNTFQYRTESLSPLFPVSPVYELTMHGASLKPYAPNAFTRSEASGNITISWKRRTRLNGALKNGTSAVPLNEESEKYDAFVLSDAYDPLTFDANNPSTYLRAFPGLTSPNFTYTAAQLAEDGLTVNSVVHVVVFQISAHVGRGFAGSDSLVHSLLTAP